jgi:hypothetical protein
MKFVPLFLALFLLQVLASQDGEESHDAVVCDSTTLSSSTTPNSQQPPPPARPEKLLPWPLNSLLPRRFRRISFRKLTVFILKQPIRLLRHVYHMIKGDGKGKKEEDYKRVADNQHQ